MKTKLLLLSLVFSLGGREMSISHGQQSFWNNSLGGDFHDPGNWIPLPPGFSDEAIFEIPGTSYAITFMTTGESSSVTVRDNEVTFDLALQAYEVLGIGEITVTSSSASNGIPTSLTVNGGSLNATGLIDITNGGILNGDGQLMGSELNVGSGSTLGGTLTFTSTGTLNNDGRVAPGNSSSIGTLNVSSSFQQNQEGTLEIEIDGSGPGNVGDLLQHSGGGTITLAGKLSVPFIGAYVPQVNDTFTFLDSSLPSGGILGAFESLSVPGLSGPLAARIDYTATTASITFVTATNRTFIPAALSPVGPNYWGSQTFWGGGLVPDSTNTVNLTNTTANNLTIELRNFPPEPASINAITHFTAVAGNSNTMTLTVPEGTSFTAVQQLDVNNKGVLNLAGGAVHSNLVKINPGGALVGIGTIDGDLQIGTNASASSPAVYSPGNSPGTQTITGNLQINSNGMLNVDVENTNSFDMVMVTQTANLGGTLNVVSGAIAPLPTNDTGGVVIIDANSVLQRFENVVSPVTNDYFFAPKYESSSVSLFAYLDGDMDRNGDRNPADVVAFAMAVTNPDSYFNQFDIFGEQSGDINNDGLFDFDDIEPFSQLSGIGLTAADIVAAIEAFQHPVPEPSSLLTIFGLVCLLAASRGCYCVPIAGVKIVGVGSR